MRTLRKRGLAAAIAQADLPVTPVGFLRVGLAIAPLIFVGLLRFSSPAMARVYSSFLDQVIQMTAYVIALLGFVLGKRALAGVARVLGVEEANRAKIKVTLLTSVVILLTSLTVTIAPTLILLTREGVSRQAIDSSLRLHPRMGPRGVPC